MNKSILLFRMPDDLDALILADVLVHVEENIGIGGKSRSTKK